jgi:hypothetical protein
MERLFEFLKRIEIRAVMGVVVLGFGLGCLGYYEMYLVSPKVYFPEGELHFTLWDVFYSTLMLFILEAGADNGSGDWHAAVQAARFMAPVGIGWAAIRAAMALLADQIRELRRARLKGHIIIVGGSAASQRLVLEYGAQRNVVLICHDAAMQAYAGLSRRVFLLEGDAAAAGTLKDARVRHAERVFLTTGQESRNRDVVTHIARYLDANGPTHVPDGGDRGSQAPVLLCHLELGHAAGSVLRASKAVEHLKTEHVSVGLFDPSRIAARLLLRDHPPHHARIPAKGARPLHVLVVGFAELGREVVKQLVRLCHYTDLQNLQITIVDAENRRNWDRFRKEVPALGMVADVTYEERDPRAIIEEQWDALQGRGGIDAVYITTLDSDDSHAIAADARNGLGGKEAPGLVVICTTELTPSHSAGAQSGLVVHDLERAEWAQDYLLDCKADAVAVDIHCRYLEKREKGKQEALAVDDVWTPKLAELPWDMLPEWLRDQNRDQVDHYPVQLAMLEAHGVTVDQCSALETQNPELLETLSIVEHRRWMASRVLAGFTYAPGGDDIVKRTHPNLKPYVELDDGTKDYDRDVIRSLGTTAARIVALKSKETP